jgi:hypothetical protein
MASSSETTQSSFIHISATPRALCSSKLSAWGSRWRRIHADDHDGDDDDEDEDEDDSNDDGDNERNMLKGRKEKHNQEGSGTRMPDAAHQRPKSDPVIF